MSNIGNKLFRLIIFILCVFITVIIAYYSRDCNLFFGDATMIMYWNAEESFFDCLNFNIHSGGYIGSFFTKFFGFGLPTLLGIHPADFIGVPNGIIKGLFASVIFILMTNFAVIFRKSNLLYLLCFNLLISVFFIYSQHSLVISCNYNYYRYFFTLLIVCIFYSYIIKNILIKHKKTNYINLVIASVAGYFLGTSVEINSFSFLSFVFLIFLYSLFVRKFIKDEKLLKSLQIHLDKNFYIPSFFLILTNIFIMLPKEGFISMAAYRGFGKTSLTFSLFKEFFESLANLYFFDNLVLWIPVIILFLISAYFAVKRNEIKKIIIPVFHIFSVFLVLLSLVVLGKTNYDNYFWTTHPNIIFLCRMLLIYPLFYYLGYSFKNLSPLKIFRSKKSAVFFISVVLILTISNIICISKDYPYNYLYLYKEKAYIAEKMLRFYCLRNERPVLPKKNYLSPEFDCWRFLGEHNENNYYIDNIITSSYYPRIYKDKSKIELGVDTSDNAFRQFYKLGGNFSKEELNHIKFSRLFDEDFVLNRNHSPKEIQEIMDRPI